MCVLSVYVHVVLHVLAFFMLTSKDNKDEKGSVSISCCNLIIVLHLCMCARVHAEKSRVSDRELVKTIVCIRACVCDLRLQCTHTSTASPLETSMV